MITHLRLLQDINIHIAGPRMGQMYQTFLLDNLGGLGYIKQNTTVENYTSFTEQYMTAGTPYIKGLYYPINERTKGAAQLIIDRFSISVNSKGFKLLTRYYKDMKKLAWDRAEWLQSSYRKMGLK